MSPSESLRDIPEDIEPGFTEHRLQQDLDFLAFVKDEADFDAFVEDCVWRAKHRRERRASQ